MKTSVSLYEAKTQLSTLLRDVEAGAVVTITRHGKPVAELRSVEAAKLRRKAGCAKSADFYIADDFDAPLAEFAEYMPDFRGASARVAEEPPRPRGKRTR